MKKYTKITVGSKWDSLNVSPNNLRKDNKNENAILACKNF